MKKKRKKKAPERNVLAFALPLLTLLSVMASVLLWSYTSERFGNAYRGYAKAGRTSEVFLEVIKQPAVAITFAALLMFDAAALAAVAGAIKKKRPGAAFFLVLTLINAALFPAIMYAAAVSAAS